MCYQQNFEWTAWMANILRKLAVIGLLLASSFRVSAEITIFDGYFMDTDSDLDWRVITSDTMGWSYNFVSNNFDAGEKFEGWRYATDLELLILVNNVGGSEVTDYTKTTLTEDAAEYSIADDLITYFSPTSSANNTRLTSGLLLQDGSSKIWVAEIADRDSPNVDDTVYIHRTGGNGVDGNYTQSAVGSFLVRESVSPN